jgi:hypothetical protein
MIASADGCKAGWLLAIAESAVCERRLSGTISLRARFLRSTNQLCTGDLIEIAPIRNDHRYLSLYACHREEAKSPRGRRGNRAQLSLCILYPRLDDYLLDGSALSALLYLLYDLAVCAPWGSFFHCPRRSFSIRPNSLHSKRNLLVGSSPRSRVALA